MTDDVFEATAYVRGELPIEFLDWPDVKAEMARRWPGLYVALHWPRRGGCAVAAYPELSSDAARFMKAVGPMLTDWPADVSSDQSGMKLEYDSATGQAILAAVKD